MLPGLAHSTLEEQSKYFSFDSKLNLKPRTEGWLVGYRILKYTEDKSETTVSL